MRLLLVRSHDACISKNSQNKRPTVGFNCAQPTPPSAPLALLSAPFLLFRRSRLPQNRLLLPHRRPQKLRCRFTSSARSGPYLLLILHPPRTLCTPSDWPSVPSFLRLLHADAENSVPPVVAVKSKLFCEHLVTLRTTPCFSCPPTATRLLYLCTRCDTVRLPS